MMRDKCYPTFTLFVTQLSLHEPIQMLYFIHTYGQTYLRDISWPKRPHLPTCLCMISTGNPRFISPLHGILTRHWATFYFYFYMYTIATSTNYTNNISTVALLRACPGTHCLSEVGEVIGIGIFALLPVSYLIRPNFYD